MLSTARKPCPSACRLCDPADSNSCSYENFPPKVYRIDSLDSLSFTTEKDTQACKSRRADDNV